MEKNINENLQLNNKSQSLENKAQIDKVTTDLYRINTFKVCESEMISKNKLSRLDKDKNTPKDKDKTEHKDMLDKISNKISTINETSTILVEIKVKLKNKYKSMCELQNDIYSDDSC